MANIISINHRTKEEEKDFARMKELDDFLMNADHSIAVDAMVGNEQNKIEENYAKKFFDAKRELHELFEKYNVRMNLG